jgi:hypothetical protein
MLKELEDYKWFPATLRRWQMDYIGNISKWLNLYKPLLPVIECMLKRNEVELLQDTCSGNGFAAMYVKDHLKIKLHLLLSDKYPDSGFENLPGIEYALHPLDLLALKPVEKVLYTMFNAFHHFTDIQQAQIYNKMADNNCPFLFVEILEPGFINLCKIIFTTTILQLLLVPFVKPFSWLRLLFTYIIPLNLFTICWDGIISVLKSKPVMKYEEQFKNLATGSFTVTVNKISNWKGNIIYIKGEPANQ